LALPPSDTIPLEDTSRATSGAIMMSQESYDHTDEMGREMFRGQDSEEEIGLDPYPRPESKLSLKTVSQIPAADEKDRFNSWLEAKCDVEATSSQQKDLGTTTPQGRATVESTPLLRILSLGKTPESSSHLHADAP